MDDPGDLDGILARSFLLPGDDRHVGRLSLFLGEALSPSRSITSGVRSDESQTCGLDGAGERGVLGQKSEAGMDGLGAGRSLAAITASIRR